jgi:hypothetical protein
LKKPILHVVKYETVCLPTPKNVALRRLAAAARQSMSGKLILPSSIPVILGKVSNWYISYLTHFQLCYGTFCFFFFLIAIPVFSHTAFYGTFRSAVFSIPISFAFSGDATGLRGTFPGHPRPFHLTFTDIHNNIYTPMGAFSRRDSNPC